MSFLADIACYLQCIPLSTWQYLMLSATGIFIIFSILLLFRQKYPLMFLAQISATALILFNIVIMKCNMFQAIWIYLGVILIGTILILVGKYYLVAQIRETVQNPRYVSELSSFFGLPIKILNVSRILAFAHKKIIYVSVGLLEVLEQGEIKAVIAHEAYHAKNSPNMLYVSFFALTSLMFIRWNDESAADRYAVAIAGADNLKSALQKLEIKNWERRISRL